MTDNADHSNLFPTPLALWEGWFKWSRGSIAAVSNAQQASLEASLNGFRIVTDSVARFWGQSTDDASHKDRRFAHEAWSESLPYATMKQAYLVLSQWIVDLADGWEALDPNLHHRAKFWTRQFVDALSPTNFAVTNPEVIQETVRTGGANLVHGTQNFIIDLLNGRLTQVPEDAFQVGEDLACTPGKVVYRNPLIEIMQYTPTTDTVYPIPMLMIPPWINKYYVMDMEPHNSMYKYLVDGGFTVFTISWKNPDESVLHLEWDDYVELGPLTALRVVQEITGAKKVNLVGYCLGGIVLQTTLAYLAACGEDAVANTATFFTTHQDFTDTGDIAVFLSQPEVQLLEWLMEASGGYLDSRNMAWTFNMLRANDILWHFYVNNYLLGKEPPAFGLLYWNNDGTRVPGRVHSFLLREYFLGNKLQEPGAIKVKGVGIDVGRVTTPAYVVTAARDHIVPWRGAFKIRELMGGPVRFVLTEGGHIAGVINPPNRKRARTHWINDNADTTDPDQWLASATAYEKSWWLDWIPWLKKRSGRRVAPPSMGSQTYPPVMDAPGTYVLEE